MGVSMSIIVLMAAGFRVYGQDRPVFGYYLLAQGGWAQGNISGGAIGTTAGGLRLGRWEWGLASGIDNAGVTSVPALADVRWTFYRGRTSLSLFSQEGWNFNVQRKEPVYSPYEGTTYYVTSPPYTTAPPTIFDYTLSYRGGPYWTGGLSWLLPAGKAGGLLVSLGSDYKQYQSIITYPGVYIPGGNMPGGYSPPTSHGVSHREWRGVLTVGWEFHK